MFNTQLLATPPAPSPSPAAFLLRQGLKVGWRLRLLLSNGDVTPLDHFWVCPLVQAPFPSRLAPSSQARPGALRCTHSVLIRCALVGWPAFITRLGQSVSGGDSLRLCFSSLAPVRCCCILPCPLPLPCPVVLSFSLPCS